MRSLIILLLMNLVVGSAHAEKTASQQGGVTDGPPIIDSAGYGNKGSVLSLGGDRSSCLSTEIRFSSPDPSAPIPPLTVTGGYEAGTLWVNNKCSIPIEFKFCSTGPVNDGFNCKPHTSPVPDENGQYFTVYDQGEGGVGPNQSTPMPVSKKNQLVWFACESSDDGGSPMLTSANSPMGICWKPRKSPDNTPNSTTPSTANQVQQSGFDQPAQEQTGDQSQAQIQAQQEELNREEDELNRQMNSLQEAGQSQPQYGQPASDNSSGTSGFLGVVVGGMAKRAATVNVPQATSASTYAAPQPTYISQQPLGPDCSLPSNANVLHCVCNRNPNDFRCTPPEVANKPTPTPLNGSGNVSGNGNGSGPSNCACYNGQCACQ